LVELRVDRGEAPQDSALQFRVEQAFLRLSPFNKVDVALQLGKFVSPFGNYPQRHQSSTNPLIRPPLPYDYRTMVVTKLAPATNDAFINWKYNPQFFRHQGAPPVWDAPYQIGALILGTIGPVSFRVAAMNGAPSVEPEAWNYMPDVEALSHVLQVALQATSELRVGASYSNGPYLDEDDVGALLPPGKTAYDYYQRLYGLEATFTRGLIELRGELLHDAWEVPRVADDPIDVSYYLESKFKLKPGLFVTGRYSAINFNDLHYSNLATSPWDFDVSRVQLGAGYRISEPFEVRGEVMLNHSAAPASLNPQSNLFAVQASWSLN
jgi:hypothetical protein